MDGPTLAVIFAHGIALQTSVPDIPATRIPNVAGATSTVATGGTPTASGAKDYTTTNDTRTTVNSVNFPYLLTSGGTTPDVTYNANPRYVRVQASAYDYDSSAWYSSWTGRI